MEVFDFDREDPFAPVPGPMLPMPQPREPGITLVELFNTDGGLIGLFQPCEIGSIEPIAGGIGTSYVTTRTLVEESATVYRVYGTPQQIAEAMGARVLPGIRPKMTTSEKK